MNVFDDFKFQRGDAVFHKTALHVGTLGMLPTRHIVLDRLLVESGGRRMYSVAGGTNKGSISAPFFLFEEEMSLYPDEQFSKYSKQAADALDNFLSKWGVKDVQKQCSNSDQPAQQV